MATIVVSIICKVAADPPSECILNMARSAGLGREGIHLSEDIARVGVTTYGTTVVMG